MSDPELFWFHCGRCGTLFQDHARDPDKRRCADCGEDPNPGMTEAASPVASPTTDGGKNGKRGKRTKRKRKGRFIMLKLLLLWILVSAAVIVIARKKWHAEPKEIVELPESVPAAVDLKSSENIALYQKARRECAAVFLQFLKADNPDARTQFVFSPFTVAGRMLNFYSTSPAPSIDTSTLELTDNALLILPEGPAFEAHWKTKDGKTLETVFHQEEEGWRLDWQDFVRYGDHPWTLFLAGTGPDEGEFRLLARERLAEERKNAESISLVLYASRFGRPQDPSPQSPEFLVSRNTRDGKLLDAAFKLEREGGKIFNSTLPRLDPDGMIRVRVKVRRINKEEGEIGYEIISVGACHWLAVDDPGVVPEPDAPAEELKPEAAKPQDER